MASKEERCQALVKAEMSISKAQDVREETSLMMKPYANWEEYLMPAPLSISLLGQLIFISAGQGDFSINKNPPPEGFKQIKYPESFRACLCQVSNDGWQAFNEAHVNMDQIRLLTASVPGRIKLMVQTLFQDMEVVNALIPGQLKSMKSITEECTARAVAVEKKYASVISLIQELLETCINAKQGYDTELREVKTALKQAKIQEETVKKNQQMAEEYNKAMKQQIDESFNSYKKAMEEIPTGWKAVGMTIVENLGNAVAGLAEGFTKMFTGKTAGLGTHGPSAGPDTPTCESAVPERRICGLSEMILTYAAGLRDLVKEDGLDMDRIFDRRTEDVQTNWVKKNFLRLKNQMEDEKNCPAKDKGLNVCKLGVRVCEQLEQIATNSKKGKDEVRSVMKEIQKLYHQAAEFDSYSKSQLGSTSFAPKAPNVAKYQQNSTKGSSALRNAHLKVEQSREMLKATQEEYQRSFDEVKRQNQELADIVCLMQQCKVKEIDFKAALRMLSEGLKAMGKVKEQWEKMIRFFQMISNLIDACLSRRINDFLTSVKDVQSIEGYSSNSFVKDLIYNQVFSASNVAHLVHMIAETYTEVSEKHLMDRISSLGRLITLESSDPEFDSEREALRIGCDEACKDIKNMVTEKKEEFDRSIEARVATIDRELKAVLPAISQKEKRMIKDAVHHGIKEMTASEEDQFS